MKKMITLFADEGKILTNGVEYGTVVSLAEGNYGFDYYEIPLEEYEYLCQIAQVESEVLNLE